ncbi:MAG: hypothetical protein A3D38_00610 [Candidatus Portnoybacteria bacterium RIFCSPHIGHO2_02_FULL_40_23]|uniref:Uncharacterized protein n=2 Tax=Candidatus Portnoyibacteriota TaxID=1817913 RepID=A0A1G2FDT6_9BACT|nr:MAG: hypothetical protein A2815_02625 [Candidatus Portnoybacteria bacterium RIFCSPHIGHO2_01_FULL_40_12b]OGZ36346.1 MAG: hypothetical protein A3D38_00610 [Candidatus Portnoybacteria bacterium RIFCSPHIGHO2_02_FULL_40_23]OGZ40314.1 MAG: hypothetical protein A3I20_00105 [Candidatus Portnoybacteria bacterium RIFCSPLOWO2_02_FULL_40_15]
MKRNIIKIRKINEKFKTRGELKWNNKEELKLESRIVRLRNDQIGALLNLVGLNFAKEDIEEVVRDIREDKHESGHLSILIYEADSKENLLWWINYFEKENSSTSKE